MTIDYIKYRQSPREQARIGDFLRLLPAGRKSVLDIGARDGHISCMLTDHFHSVTALDLTMPSFSAERVTTVQGDVTRLEFADNAFDVVCCLEVLEHIPAPVLEKACCELARVARHEIIIGVPYRQDLRVARTTCEKCGRSNPPWGHWNSFDSQRLQKLFAPHKLMKQTYVGETRERTTALAAFLMNLGGNPWGSYGQEEPCVHCSAELIPPNNGSLWKKACAGLALRMDNYQAKHAAAVPLWTHVVFQKLQ